jgi:hypothetical protein
LKQNTEIVQNLPERSVVLFYNLTRDGQIRWIEHSCQPVVDNQSGLGLEVQTVSPAAGQKKAGLIGKKTHSLALNKFNNYNLCDFGCGSGFQPR